MRSQRQFCRIALAMTAAGCLASAAPAAPPRVVKAVPDNGAKQVAASLRQISVTFDQDMDRRSYSWTGGGKTFPEMRGSPQWTDARTCVLRVRLKPNWKYWLSVNSKSHKDFRSRTGIPAVPYPIAFTTASRGPTDPAKTWSLDVKDGVAELRRCIRRNYSYRDLHKLDWDKLFGRYSPKMLRAGNAGEFATAAAELLAHAKDPHLWVKVGDKGIPVFRRKVTPNYNLNVLARLVPKWRKHNRCVSTGKFADGIGYILISSWAREDIEVLEKAFEALEDFADAKALIIDVRPNGGGSETLAQFFAGCFASRSVVYAMHAYRDGGPAGGFGRTQKRVLRPKKGRPKYRGKVAVLTGPVNMSSCEAFLLMMKQVPRCTLVGGRSYGSSGNPRRIDLGIGVAVYLPSWKAMRPDGTAFEGEGIAPDMEVKVQPSDLARDDPVLQAGGVTG